MLRTARDHERRIGHAGYVAHAVLWLGIAEAKAGRPHRATVLLTHGEEMFARRYGSIPPFHARRVQDAWDLVRAAP